MTETARGQGGRILWLDVARALGIALVVYGHVGRGLMEAGILQAPVWDQVDFAIYTFHMPLFFYLSGLNVMGSRDRPGFLARRARAILLPYLVFSLAQGLVQLVLAGQTNGQMTWTRLLMIPVDPISPFWFLYVLLIFTAVVALWRPGPAMLAVAGALLVLSAWLRGPDPWLLFEICYFFLFYVAGCLYRPGRLPAWAGIGAAALWLVTVLAGRALGLGDHDYYALLMLPAALGGLVAMLWLSQRLEGAGGWLAYMGQNVIAIYVMHILATAGTRIILKGFGVSAATPHVILGTLAGIALPLAALWCLQRLGLARLIGLPPGRRRPPAEVSSA